MKKFLLICSPLLVVLLIGASTSLPGFRGTFYGTFNGNGAGLTNVGASGSFTGTNATLAGTTTVSGTVALNATNATGQFTNLVRKAVNAGNYTNTTTRSPTNIDLFTTNLFVQGAAGTKTATGDYGFARLTNGVLDLPAWISTDQPSTAPNAQGITFWSTNVPVAKIETWANHSGSNVAEMIFKAEAFAIAPGTTPAGNFIPQQDGGRAQLGFSGGESIWYINSAANTSLLGTLGYSDGMSTWPFGHSQRLAWKAVSTNEGNSTLTESRPGIYGVGLTNVVDSTYIAPGLGELWFTPRVPEFTSISAGYSGAAPGPVGKMLTNGWWFKGRTLRQKLNQPVQSTPFSIDFSQADVFDLSCQTNTVTFYATNFTAGRDHYEGKTIILRSFDSTPTITWPAEWTVSSGTLPTSMVPTQMCLVKLHSTGAGRSQSGLIVETTAAVNDLSYTNDFRAIPGLAMFYSASDYQVGNTRAVTSMPDFSTNRFHGRLAGFSIEAGYNNVGTLYNNANYVQFNNIHCYQTNFASTNLQTNTVFVVCDPGTTGFIFDSAQSTERNAFFFSGGLPAIYAGTTLAMPTRFPTNRVVVYELGFRGANSYIKTNGVTAVTGDAGAQGCKGITMGANNTGTASFSDGKLLSLLFYNGPLTAAQTTIVQEGLRKNFNAY